MSHREITAVSTTDVARRPCRSDPPETADLRDLVEIVADRLYLAAYSTRRRPCRHPDTAELHYFGFDRVPPDLGSLAEYVRRLNGKMSDRRYRSKAIVHYCAAADAGLCRDYYDNAALFVGTYAIAAKRMSPITVYGLLNRNGNENISVYEKSRNTCVGLYDCLSVVHKAVKYKFVDFNAFDSKEYKWSRDITWIVPDKFIAFRGPVEERPGRHNHPRYYVKYFRDNNVNTVIRLNSSKNYNRSWFSDANIEHIDLHFKNGSTPPNDILLDFLNISERADGAIAVHCKAGLGRTGTMIAAYLIQHYRMTTRESVAWMRMCRPGSITGSQQSFLIDHEPMLWKRGDELRKKEYGNVAKVAYCAQGMYTLSNRQNKSDVCVNR